MTRYLVVMLAVFGIVFIVGSGLVVHYGGTTKPPTVYHATDMEGCKFADVPENPCARVYHARGEWAGGAMLVAQYIFVIEGVQYIGANTPHEWRVAISPLYTWSEIHPRVIDAMRSAREVYYETRQAEEKEAKSSKRKQGA